MQSVYKNRRAVPIPILGEKYLCSVFSETCSHEYYNVGKAMVQLTQGLVKFLPGSGTCPFNSRFTDLGKLHAPSDRPILQGSNVAGGQASTSKAQVEEGQ